MEDLEIIAKRTLIKLRNLEISQLESYMKLTKSLSYLYGFQREYIERLEADTKAIIQNNKAEIERLAKEIPEEPHTLDAFLESWRVQVQNAINQKKTVTHENRH